MIIVNITMNACYVLGPALLNYLIFTITQGIGYCYPHFTDREVRL